MDYLVVLLVVGVAAVGAVAALAYRVGRAIERREAQARTLAGRVTMLCAQVEELKALVAQSDYQALRAVREFQRVEQETRRAAAILKLRE